ADGVLDRGDLLVRVARLLGCWVAQQLSNQVTQQPMQQLMQPADVAYGPRSSGAETSAASAPPSRGRRVRPVFRGGLCAVARTVCPRCTPRGCAGRCTTSGTPRGCCRVVPPSPE